MVIEFYNALDCSFGCMIQQDGHGRIFIWLYHLNLRTYLATLHVLIIYKSENNSLLYKKKIDMNKVRLDLINVFWFNTNPNYVRTWKFCVGAFVNWCAVENTLDKCQFLLSIRAQQFFEKLKIISVNASRSKTVALRGCSVNKPSATCMLCNYS